MADRKLLANCNLASLRSLISLIFVVLYADTTNAFEQETHAEITKASVVLSQLTAANGRITQSLGIPRGRIEQSDDDLECPLSLSLGLRNRSRIYYDGPRRARVACRSVFFPWDFKKMNLPVSLWIGSPEQWILVGVQFLAAPWLGDAIAFRFNSAKGEARFLRLERTDR